MPDDSVESFMSLMSSREYAHGSTWSFARCSQGSGRSFSRFVVFICFEDGIRTANVSRKIQNATKQAIPNHIFDGCPWVH